MFALVQLKLFQLQFERLELQLFLQLLLNFSQILNGNINCWFLELTFLKYPVRFKSKKQNEDQSTGKITNVLIKAGTFDSGFVLNLHDILINKSAKTINNNTNFQKLNMKLKIKGDWNWSGFKNPIKHTNNSWTGFRKDQ